MNEVGSFVSIFKLDTQRFGVIEHLNSYSIIIAGYRYKEETELRNLKEKSCQLVKERARELFG